MRRSLLLSALTVTFVVHNSTGRHLLLNCSSKRYIERTRNFSNDPLIDTSIVMHFSPQSSDQHLPDRTLRSTIETFPSSTSIQELTLNNATIPWSIFSGLLSLSSINLENVKIGDRPGEGIRFIPTPNQRAEIKHFRFRNCTDIVRKFVLVRPSHALSFDNLVSLECDMGSLESTNYGALLIDNCHQSLEALTLDYRANEDQAAKDLRGKTCPFLCASMA